MSANATNLSQISDLSNHISGVPPSKALLICVCVCACVCLMSCHCSSHWMSIKTVRPGIAKINPLPDTPSACLCFLPPRPKLPPPFGLPKPPLTGRLVEGQESASQGRPGSPAFSSPGRLRPMVWRETKGGRTQLSMQSPSPFAGKRSFDFRRINDKLMRKNSFSALSPRGASSRGRRQ